MLKIKPMLIRFLCIAQKFITMTKSKMSKQIYQQLQLEQNFMRKIKY